MNKKITLQYRDNSFTKNVTVTSNDNNWQKKLYSWLKSYHLYDAPFSNFKEDVQNPGDLVFHFSSRKEYDMAILSFKQRFA